MKITTMKTMLLDAMLAAAVWAAGCDSLPLLGSNACPKRIPGTASFGENGIAWGGTENKVSATLIGARVECMPVHHAAVVSETLNREAFTDYELAVTATATYEINDLAFFEDATRYTTMDALVAFEALSSAEARPRVMWDR